MRGRAAATPPAPAKGVRVSKFLADVVEHALPQEADDVLIRILGGALAPAGDDGRHVLVASGRFGGHLTSNLLAWLAQPKFTGALIVAEEESERVVYAHAGTIIGAASNVLFERLGRILYQAEVVTHDDSEQLVGIEENEGDAALLDWVPEDVLAWAVARRVHAVAAALPYIRRGHFVLVSGTASLDELPPLGMDPQAIAAEAERLYEAWRHGAASESEDAARPADAPAPLPSPLTQQRSREEEVDDILRRIRDADLGFK